jgi:hypothetical protein
MTGNPIPDVGLDDRLAFVGTATIALALYAIGAAWAFIPHREFAFTRRAWSIAFALIWPAMALLAVCGAIVRAVKGDDEP